MTSCDSLTFSLLQIFSAFISTFLVETGWSVIPVLTAVMTSSTVLMDLMKLTVSHVTSHVILSDLSMLYLPSLQAPSVMKKDQFPVVQKMVIVAIETPVVVMMC